MIPPAYLPRPDRGRGRQTITPLSSAFGERTLHLFKFIFYCVRLENKKEEGQSNSIVLPPVF